MNNGAAMPLDEILHCVLLETTEADVGVLDEMLGVLELEHSCVTDADTHRSTLLIVCETLELAQNLLGQVSEALPDWTDLLENPQPAISIAEVKREDWAEAWKKYFRPFRASRRLVVKPSWEQYEAQPGDIILDFDPGMCFGTGQHGTTQAVLQFLDELQAELGAVSFLDAGSGSGILTLAAAKLGYQPLAAFDYDPAAVAQTLENLGKAGVTGIPVTCEDVAKFQPAQPYRVVAANILASVLVAHAPHIASLVCQDLSQPSYLLLAGILTEQYPHVKTTYEALGFRECRQATLGEWTSGLFKKV